VISWYYLTSHDLANFLEVLLDVKEYLVVMETGCRMIYWNYDAAVTLTVEWDAVDHMHGYREVQECISSPCSHGNDDHWVDLNDLSFEVRQAGFDLGGSRIGITWWMAFEQVRDVLVRTFNLYAFEEFIEFPPSGCKRHERDSGSVFLLAWRFPYPHHPSCFGSIFRHLSPDNVITPSAEVAFTTIIGEGIQDAVVGESVMALPDNGFIMFRLEEGHP
jgi:hypothetical protein